MITSAWINGVFIILIGIMSYLPDANAEWLYFLTDKSELLSGYVRSMSYWFPVVDLFTIVSLALAFEVLLISFRIYLWITSTLTLGSIKLF